MRAAKVILALGLVSSTSCKLDSDSIDYDCSVFPPSESSSYILPWIPGQTYKANPHAARETSVQRYAIDVAMPIGTIVVAIQAGDVVRIQEDYVDGDNAAGHENYVLVEHGDGTVARYIHLTNRGAVPRLGDRVERGDVIGYSGHTGNSTEPHLHIDVTRSCCAAPNYNEMPAGETIPLTFRNALADSKRESVRNQTCGLEKNVWYTAADWFFEE
jgi:murein DD-endopeptidase MepM/ murein hydrolase activator NlpD